MIGWGIDGGKGKYLNSILERSLYHVTLVHPPMQEYRSLPR